jgi:hypothetical protein
MYLVVLRQPRNYCWVCLLGRHHCHEHWQVLLHCLLQALHQVLPLLSQPLSQ